ncbi:cytoplasmic trna 2-thiolation protein 2 [Ophiostoma piceae UAMH 11346]|uniref:Cytoplasmic tRNA 2-thiolation protein 2 n=1 Tax=Ophiostoma piceae (strain UAMH 11346) TaxID=1262450 RepID=S3CRK2_OPHP1|nr:cytoplasmic trna 2-thiolation protein 2 [Ophiostoma piceae UAMH 11346]
MPGAMTQAGPAKLCRKCKDKEAVHNIRSDNFCSECFCQFVATKTVKRLEVLNRDKRNLHNGRPNGSKTFYSGLSFGASSSALIDILEQITLSRLSRGKDASFALHVIHIDTDLQDSSDTAAAPTQSIPGAEKRLDLWRARYPRFTFERVPLVQVLALNTIDWAALQPPPHDATASSEITERTEQAARPTTLQDLRNLLANLPSATSRRDILELLVRRLLIARATASWKADVQTTDKPSGKTIQKCDALLFGYSTTALAERTLVETAKGRGFSLPWQINDGPVDDGEGHSLPLYYPVRELFRNELVQYTNACQPPLTEGGLIVSAASTSSGTDQASAVVSHRELSIEEVLTRYFADVEVNYPSVVANVVRTTAKLERHGHDEDGAVDASKGEGRRSAGCRVCGMPLDEAGNERWRGEIGRLDGPEGRPRTGMDRLCYGCDRSIHG